ncbi:MAG: 4'-phosphopantetheinyl transferase superfamily protein [Pseudomonadota bacterium]
MSAAAATAWPRRPLQALLGEGPLAARELRLWRFPLDQPVLAHEALTATLDEAERARAARFVFEHDRRRFVVAHGMLRLLLAAMLDTAPQDLRFVLQAHGKPVLAHGAGGEALHFNLSHTHGWGLLGVCRAAELGVDIEMAREVPQWQAIARTNFSAAEVQRCLEQPPARQRDAFFATWVRKEAFIKACGTGLSMPLDAFEVNLRPEPHSSLCSIQGDASQARAWCVLGWQWEPGLHAAVALRAQDVTLTCADVTS